MFKKSIKATLIGLAMLCACQSSFAVIVFDPTNWIQNTSTAIATVKTEITQATSLINQYQQLRNELRNLKEMGVVGVAARALDLENELRAVQELKSASQNLYSALQTNGDYVGGIQKLINVSALTPETWLKREASMVQQKNANATYLMETGKASLKAIESAQKQRDKVLSENDFTEGIRGTAMKTNVLIGNMISVQSQMVQQLIASSDVTASQQALETNEKRAKELEARKAISERIKAMEAAPLLK